MDGGEGGGGWNAWVVGGGGEGRREAGVVVDDGFGRGAGGFGGAVVACLVGVFDGGGGEHELVVRARGPRVGHGFADVGGFDEEGVGAVFARLGRLGFEQEAFALVVGDLPGRGDFVAGPHPGVLFGSLEVLLVEEFVE